MARLRAEPFLIVVAELRSRISRGHYAPETRFSPAELASEFGLSATPVREALARLAGEGLLEERRGLGVFLPRLTALDVADLYRLSLAHLRLALAGPPPPSGDTAAVGGGATDAEAVEASERLFRAWITHAGGRRLARSYARLDGELGRVRRLEPELLDGLAEELRALGEAVAAGTRSGGLRLRAFHDRRIRLAGRLADRLERATAGVVNSMGDRV